MTPTRASGTERLEAALEEIIGRARVYGGACANYAHDRNKPGGAVDRRELRLRELERVVRDTIAALLRAPEGAYEHPERGLTCALGGCSLRVISSGEGTCYYEPTPPGREPARERGFFRELPAAHSATVDAPSGATSAKSDPGSQVRAPEGDADPREPDAWLREWEATNAPVGLHFGFAPPSGHPSGQRLVPLYRARPGSPAGGQP